MVIYLLMMVLYQTRQSGTVLATKECGSYLRCCEIAGDLIIAGRLIGFLTHHLPCLHLSLLSLQKFVQKVF